LVVYATSPAGTRRRIKKNEERGRAILMKLKRRSVEGGKNARVTLN